MRRGWLHPECALPRVNRLLRYDTGAIASPSQRRAALPNFGESPLKAHPEGAPTGLNGLRSSRFHLRTGWHCVAFTSERTGIVSLSLANGLGWCPVQRWVNRLEGLEMSPSGVARRGENGSVALTFDLRPVRLRL